MKPKIIIALFFAVFANAATAQDYKTGIGIRLGGLTSGITVRGFTNSSSAIEGLASFGHHSFILTGLYEKFKPVANAEGLFWLYGGGAHAGFFRYGSSYYIYKDRGRHLYVKHEGENASVFGLDLILGLDYKFRNAPVNAGLDIKPFVDFFDGAQGYFDGALSLRFVF